MIYLTGATNEADEPALIARGVGLVVQPGNSYHRRYDRYPFYIYDNGCFADKWDEDKWINRLGILRPGKCLFAVAPDVYPDAKASLARGREWSPIIRDMGFPVAVVAQDGAEQLDFPWGEFDCLFVGGKRTPNPKDEWKVSAAAESLVLRARTAGLWVHMGRVNSGKGYDTRMARAREMGCHSADGTFLKYRKRKKATDVDGSRDARGASEICDWMDWLDDHQPLSLRTFETPSLPIYKEALA